MKENRILVCGHGMHGKDITSSVIDELYGYKFRGSSEVMCNEPEILSQFKYETGDELFENRRKHRKKLYNAICKYNEEDKARLAKKVMQDGQYGYTGMRDFDEVMECIKQGLFTHIIWVERKGAPLDPTQTFTFEDLHEEFQREENTFSLAKVINYPVDSLLVEQMPKDKLDKLIADKLKVMFVKRNMNRFLEMSNTFTMFA